MLILEIVNWFKEKELDKADSKKQLLKFMEELGEYIAGYLKNNKESRLDAIGDMGVVFIGYLLQQKFIIDDHIYNELMHNPITKNIKKNSMNDRESLIFALTAIINQLFNQEDRVDVMIFAYIFSLLELIAEFDNISFIECLEKAYEEIKDRTGKTINGVFVKQEDLQ